MSASIRAIPEVGEPYDDPSEDALFLLLEDLEAGRGTFLIVERTADPTGQTFAQAVRGEDGTYTVEHREGDAQRHFGTDVADTRAAHRLLTGWAFRIEGWDTGETWTRVSF